MAKKFTLSSLLTAVAALLGVVAIVMLFLPAVALDIESDVAKKVIAAALGGESYTGLQVTFGLSKNDITYFGFSFMNLLPYLLRLGGVVLALLNVFGKKPSKLFAIIAAALFIVAGILFFCTVGFAAVNEDLTKLFSALKGDVKDYLALSAGPIVAGILSILAGVGAATPLFLKK